MSFYRLFVPAQAVGANLVYFDFWNPVGSERTVEITALQPVVVGSTAVVGTLAVDLYLTRTTAVGTGGTAATFGGTALNAATFSAHSGSGAQAFGFTARLTPSGGATAGEVIGFASVFTEETNSATYMCPVINLARPFNAECPGVFVARGSGVRVVQGSVASVGNIGFNMVFRTIRA